MFSSRLLGRLTSYASSVCIRQLLVFLEKRGHPHYQINYELTGTKSKVKLSGDDFCEI